MAAKALIFLTWLSVSTAQPGRMRTVARPMVTIIERFFIRSGLNFAPRYDKYVHRQTGVFLTALVYSPVNCYVRLKGSELYLTPSDPGGEANSSIVLQVKKEGDLQRWTLVEQHPTM